MPGKGLYKEKIIDHYKNPRNFRKLEKADYQFHLSNTVCGDEVTVYLKVVGDIVKEVGFEGSGCAISIAGMSILSEELIGMKVKDVESLDNEYVLDLLGMDKRTPRIKCAVLGLDAVKRSIKMDEDEPCDFC